MSDILDGIRAHIKRADDMLTHLDKALDEAVDKLAHLPMNNLRFGSFQAVACVRPLAPLNDIMGCIAGGGVVMAVIGTKAQWAATAITDRNNVTLGRILECNSTQMKVEFSDGKTAMYTDPAKQILVVFLLWVGG